MIITNAKYWRIPDSEVNGVKKVYPMKPVGDSDCATLTLQNTLDTPDHKFFNYPVMNLPKSGAVLINEFSSDPEIILSIFSKLFFSSPGLILSGLYPK